MGLMCGGGVGLSFSSRGELPIPVPQTLCPFKGSSSIAHLQTLILGAPAATLDKEKGQASRVQLRDSLCTPLPRLVPHLSPPELRLG